MVANAGLGIAFNAKEILKKVADGTITRDNMKGVLYCLGISGLDLRKTPHPPLSPCTDRGQGLQMYQRHR